MGWCGCHPGVKTGENLPCLESYPRIPDQLHRMGWGLQWHGGSWPVLTALSATTPCQASSLASHTHTTARRDHLVEIWGLWHPDSAQSKQTAQHLRHVEGKRQLQLEGRRKENLQFWIIAWLFCSRRRSHNHLLGLLKAAAARRRPGRTHSHGQRFSARPWLQAGPLYSQTWLAEEIQICRKTEMPENQPTWIRHLKCINILFLWLLASVLSGFKHCWMLRTGCSSGGARELKMFLSRGFASKEEPPLAASCNRGHFNWLQKELSVLRTLVDEG